MDITRAFGARIGGSSPSEGARQLRSNWRWRRQKDSKAGATTVARRGRGIFQQKNICDRVPPKAPDNYEVIGGGDAKRTRKPEPRRWRGGVAEFFRRKISV
jgi:hypothetical protein